MKLKIQHILTSTQQKYRNLAQKAGERVGAYQKRQNKKSFIEGSDINGSNFHNLWQQEWKLYLKNRRKNRQYENNVDPEIVKRPTTNLNLVGIALSGGGIRSATFNLGLIQALARLKFFKFCDYLSTVSGGSYIGACLTAHLNRNSNQLEGKKFPFGFPQAGKESSGEERPEVRHLRNHSKYLAPELGLFSLHTWHIIATYSSGLLLLFPVFLSALLIVPTYLIEQVSLFAENIPWKWPSGGSFWLAQPVWDWKLSKCLKIMNSTEPTWCWLSASWAPPGIIRMLVTIIVICLSGFLFSVVFFLIASQPIIKPNARETVAKVQSWLLLLAVIALIVSMLPSMVWGWERIWEKNPWTGEWAKWSVSVFAFILTIGAYREWPNPWLNRVKLSLVKIGVVIFLISFGLSSLDFYRTHILHHPINLICISTLVFVAFGLLDPNRVSMHFLYRDRLAQAYVSKPSESDPNKFVPDHDLLLSTLQRRDKLSDIQEDFHPPYHLINATINLSGDNDPDLRGREAHLFEFSPHYCGSEKTGWRATEKYESGKLDLATAMAISGAAVGSLMGKYTTRPMGMLMALLNIRLGSWLHNPNPKYQGFPFIRKVFTLFRELFGHTSRKTPYVNLSDGGHFENLGLYPLIQRRCKLIIVSDVGEDGRSSFSDLEEALRKIKIDFGVQVENLRLKELIPHSQTRYSESHCAIGDIVYPSENDRKEEKGVLVYIKPTLSPHLPVDLLRYSENHKNFPHDTTTKQLFDEAEFESYRSLGYQIGKNIYSDLQRVSQFLTERKFTGDSGHFHKETNIHMSIQNNGSPDSDPIQEPMAIS